MRFFAVSILVCEFCRIFKSDNLLFRFRSISIMSFWKSDVLRILGAATLAFLVGGIYYNPANPMMKTWMETTYPGISDPRTVMDPTIAMIGTAVAHLLVATVMNRYVNTR